MIPFVILVFLAGIIAAFSLTWGKNGEVVGRYYKYGLGVAGFIFFYAVLSTSFVVVGNEEAGHIKRKYFGNPLPENRIIALEGENGPQAKILGPGFYFEFLINIFNDIEMKEVLYVEDNSVAILTAIDGAPLRSGQFIADEWSDKNKGSMLDALFFLTNGGQRGPQLDVLKPGKYRINRYLWNAQKVPAYDVPAGSVAVVKSNIGPIYTPKTQEEIELQSKLSIPLVPKGFFGVWNEPLMQGRYYLNTKAYETFLIQIRLNSFEYKGGYVGDNESSKETQVPDGAADRAINAKSKDGFNFPVELRVQAQVDPKDAPFVYASVGGLQELEDNILTPTVRAEVRNSTESQNALDFLNARSKREKEIEENVTREVKKGGLSVREVRIGEIFLPKELLNTQTRQKIASEMENAFAAERRAEDARKLKEKATAEANKQGELVGAEYAVKVAEQKKQEKEKLGQGEANYLSNLAKGQREQYEALAKVIGPDNFAKLEAIRFVLENYKGPLVPNVLVQGGGGSSLEGAAAVLKNTPLGEMFPQQKVKSSSQETPVSSVIPEGVK